MHITDPWLSTAATPSPPAAPPITTGTFVAHGTTKGKADLIITSGTIPGATSPTGHDVTGTPDRPAARIIEHAPAGNGTYRPTGRKIAAPLPELTRIPPLRTREAKSLPEALAWAHHTYPHTPTGGPSAHTLNQVYSRGVKSWPGEHTTTLTARQWGLSRVDAFIATWHGDRPAGYHRDDDLLADG